jgi:GntP family gluconate:H+ symporter
MGLTATHSLVPPTPGPIATAGILGADLGLVIFWGAILSALALVPCFFFVKYYVTRFDLQPKMDEAATSSISRYPSLGKATLPIAIPLVLIVLASIANYPSRPFGEGPLVSILIFLGAPVIALLIGAFLSFNLPEKFEIRLLSSNSWIAHGVAAAAPIILITGAGGVFGMMLQNSGIADLVSKNMADVNWGIFLPFLMAFALKTAQGSSTVAMITTATIMAPLLPVLGLDGDLMKVFASLAVGCGALAISHANDSFFWVMTQMSGMNIKMGNQTHSLGTLILSCTAILLLYLFVLIM